jgi:3-dehydroquinate dehydratase/shikimate dehydrogenase
MSFISGNKPDKCKLIVSSHNYEHTPSCEELANLVARIQAVGADIVKVATTAKDIVDVSRMFQVMVHCQVSVFQTEMHFSFSSHQSV